MKKLFYVAFSVLLVVFGLTISLHNRQTVSINYYSINFQIELMVLLFFIFVGGVAVGVLATGMSVLKSRRNFLRLRRETSKSKKLSTRESI